MMKNMVAIKQRYDQITIPQHPGEREWFDRLRTWDMFVDMGPTVLDVMSASCSLQEMIDDAPDLYGLLVEAFEDQI